MVKAGLRICVGVCVCLLLDRGILGTRFFFFLDPKTVDTASARSRSVQIVLDGLPLMDYA